QGPRGEILGTQRTYQAEIRPPAVTLDGPERPPQRQKGLFDGGLAGMLPMAGGAGIGGWSGWLAAGAHGRSHPDGLAHLRATRRAALASGCGVGLAAAFLRPTGRPLAGLGLLGGVVLGAFLFPANPILGGVAMGLAFAAAGYLFNNFFGGSSTR